MNHEEFKEKYLIGSGHSTRVLLEDYNCSVSVKSIVKFLNSKGSSLVEFYSKYVPDEGCKSCGEPNNLYKLSRGWSEFCSFSCKNRYCRTSQQKDPAFLEKKSLGIYGKFESITLYLILNGSHLKYGLSHGRKRLKSIESRLKSSRTYEYDLPTEVACKLESELILLGTRVEELNGSNGSTEVRSIEDFELIRSHIECRLIELTKTSNCIDR